MQKSYYTLWSMLYLVQARSGDLSSDNKWEMSILDVRRVLYWAGQALKCVRDRVASAGFRAFYIIGILSAALPSRPIVVLDLVWVFSVVVNNSEDQSYLHQVLSEKQSRRPLL